MGKHPLLRGAQVDAIYLIVVAAFFTLTWGFVRLCERL
jgi:hypothetical protein